MSIQSMLLWTLAGLAALLAAACAAPTTAMGPDSASGSEASTVAWQDGKTAYAISCTVPQGCQQRALALCNNGNYTVLKSENMPTPGTYFAVPGKPLVVIRCG